MTWLVPTPEIVRSLRLRDGPNFLIPEDYLANLLIDEGGNIHFPIYSIDGTQIGWNSRSATQKMWSQTLSYDAAPRFTSWTSNIAQIIYDSRCICLAESGYDALSLAPVVPWVISTNTARVQKEILEWIKDWKLHVFTAFDIDKEAQGTGQNSTQEISRELREFNCMVDRIQWPSVAQPPFGYGTHIKDPAQAYALMGRYFQELVKSQVHAICSVIH